MQSAIVEILHEKLNKSQRKALRSLIANAARAYSVSQNWHEDAAALAYFPEPEPQKVSFYGYADFEKKTLLISVPDEWQVKPSAMVDEMTTLTLSEFYPS